MSRKKPRGDLPQIHLSTFADPTAILCGLVVVEGNVFIGLHAVIRADEMDAGGHIAPIDGRVVRYNAVVGGVHQEYVDMGWGAHAPNYRHGLKSYRNLPIRMGDKAIRGLFESALVRTPDMAARREAQRRLCACLNSQHTSGEAAVDALEMVS